MRFILIILVISFCPAYAAQRFVGSIVPHYSEFDPAENPNYYYWCGHAALKSVGQYITGSIKSLSAIHNTFYWNSATYRADQNCLTPGNHWCAKLQDLVWAAQLGQNGGYNRPNSVYRTVNNINDFFIKIKDGVNLSYPPIVPSMAVYGNAGHFWIIVGYNDIGSPGMSTLYLRDVAMSGVPSFSYYDRTIDVQSFYNGALFNGLAYILYVK